MGATGAGLLMRAGDAKRPPPPMRLACAMDGASNEAMARVSTVREVEVRKEVFTEGVSSQKKGGLSHRVGRAARLPPLPVSRHTWGRQSAFQWLVRAARQVQALARCTPTALARVA